MKKIIFVGLMLLALVRTAVMAQQEGASSMQGMMQEKSKEASSEPMKGMQGMMQEMVKGQQSGEGSMQGMGGMMAMMMKMMEQCSAMMESSHHPSEAAKEKQK